jgi:hypothetical protein
MRREDVQHLFAEIEERPGQALLLGERERAGHQPARPCVVLSARGGDRG